MLTGGSGRDRVNLRGSSSRLWEGSLDLALRSSDRSVETRGRKPWCAGFRQGTLRAGVASRHGLGRQKGR